MFTFFKHSLFSLLLSTFVFTEASSMTMQELNKLTDPDGAADDNFGYSVAISGDTAIVGAPGHNSYAGVAYIYEYQSETNTFVKKASLSTSDHAINSFGHSVAINGNTVIVGADYDNCTGGVDCGSAYVFEKPASGGWVDATETAKLTASDSADGNYFGYRVGISGDTAIVGVGGYSGSAYLFEKHISEGWTSATETKLTSFDVPLFGFSFAISGDTAIVGAVGDDGSSGLVYLFEKHASEGWISATETKLTASDGAADDNFGYSVALSGETAIVGARGDNSDSGSAYIFKSKAFQGTNPALIMYLLD